MQASRTDRPPKRAARSARGSRGTREPARRRIVAAFEHRLHAERAVGALLDIGLASEQIVLEGPAVPRPEPPRPVRTDGVAWLALLGAAALAAAPAGRPIWLRAALGLPAVAVGLLAGMTAAANPAGVDPFDWTVVVAPRRRRSDVGGLLRAFGGRGVYLA